MSSETVFEICREARPIIPVEWNGVEVSFPRERSVLDFFRAHVQTRPRGAAIKDGHRSLTYAELDLRSNRLANELLRQGLPPDHPVAVLLPMSRDFITAILGILKAGGCYLPLSVDTPAVRLRFLLEDSGAGFVVTDATGQEPLRGWPGKILELARIVAATSTGDDNSPGAASHPNRRAYIIYTSGSTGRPKGVEIEHHSLTNFVWHYHRQLGVCRKERSSLLANAAFDVSMADIWPALCAGGCLVVPPVGLLLDPDGLIAWLAAEEVTLTFVPTGVAEILFTRRWPAQMKLRLFTTGGDRLRVRPPAGLSFTVLNGYGPTENTVFSTIAEVEPEDGSNRLPPIGRPLGNVKAYVLDEELQPVPVGEAGELYLGGEQVARGYFGRPGLTAEQFLPDPFDDQPGTRLYRTGDWARWLPDGQLNFLGRRDDQIQLRGIRVELGEIEATLCGHDGVNQACCVPILKEGMPVGISAHLVPNQNAPVLPSEIRSYLEARLPAKMVPSEFVIHKRFPLTTQGKLDRKLLIKARGIDPDPGRPMIVGGKLEEKLFRYWRSMLPSAESAEPDVTFQVLGGDSLLAVKLLLGVEEITGKRIEQSTFFLKPTFAGLCEALKIRETAREFEPVIEYCRSGSRTHLFSLYAMSGDSVFHSDFVEALGGDQPVYGIRCPCLASLDRMPKSIEEAAVGAIKSIRRIQPRGAPALLGYSWGGLLAFEVARQLAQSEGVHCFTALVGTNAPVRRPTPAIRLRHFAATLPRWLRSQLAGAGKKHGSLPRWFDLRNLNKLKILMRGAMVTAGAELPAPDWASPMVRQFLLLERMYQPVRNCPVQIHLFREREAHPKTPPNPLQPENLLHRSDTGWRYWSRVPPRVHWVDGDHDSILRQPLLGRLAKQIRSAMDERCK